MLIDSGKQEIPYIICRGQVTQFPDTLVYTGCPHCRKRVTYTKGSQVTCESCKLVHESPAYIFAFQIAVSDGTGSVAAKVYGEIGEVLLGSVVHTISE